MYVHLPIPLQLVRNSALQHLGAFISTLRVGSRHLFTVHGSAFPFLLYINPILVAHDNDP